MAESDSGLSKAVDSLPDMSLGAILRRVRDMVLLWVLFGGICGACSDSARDGTLIGVASGVIAGMIVLPFLGACLGLAGARLRPTLVGGCFGGLLATVLGKVVGTPSPLFLASFGLILGGLAGGTIGLMFWWLNFVARALGFPVRSR